MIAEMKKGILNEVASYIEEGTSKLGLSIDVNVHDGFISIQPKNDYTHFLYINGNSFQFQTPINIFYKERSANIIIQNIIQESEIKNFIDDFLLSKL